MELIVVMIIIGVLAVIAVLNYNTMMVQGAANAAQKNLIAIYNAQKNDYFNNGSYCTTLCDNLPDINTNLGLNILENPSNNQNDGYFTYSCAAGAPYTCAAKNIANTDFTMVITGAAQIILPGGTGCSPGGGAPCNPVCTDAANPNYCPSS